MSRFDVIISSSCSELFFFFFLRICRTGFFFARQLRCAVSFKNFSSLSCVRWSHCSAANVFFFFFFFCDCCTVAALLRQSREEQFGNSWSINPGEIWDAGSSCFLKSNVLDELLLLDKSKKEMHQIYFCIFYFFFNNHKYTKHPVVLLLLAVTETSLHLCCTLSISSLSVSVLVHKVSLLLLLLLFSWLKYVPRGKRWLKATSWSILLFAASSR